MRTRFAPSPTGYMHIGNLRTALYAYLFTRKYSGQFILRIEDTDQERLVEGATDVIFQTLKDAGISWDEGPDVGGAFGPYVQSQRRDIYVRYARQLVESGHAYYCFCDKDALETRRQAAAARGETFKYDKHCLRLSAQEVQAKLDAGEPYVIRQNIPTAGQTSFDDLVFGHITVDNAELDDNVLIKADGMPTYNFANVVDDHLMGITHVIRGMEYLASTPKYNLLYQAFGWELPLYIHLTPIMKDAHQKLSKRNGDASFGDLVAKGYLPEAVVNYIVLLGWNPGTNQEKFTLPELVEAFSVSGLSKSPAIFDPEKLRWLNAEYIRAMTPEDFNRIAQPWYAQAGVEGMDAAVLARILQPRVEVFGELPEMVDFLPQRPAFDNELYRHKKMKTEPDLAREVLSQALPRLEALPEWSEEALHRSLLGLAQESGRKNGQVMWPVRIALSGKAVTAGGAIEIAYLLGREEALARLRSALMQLG